MNRIANTSAGSRCPSCQGWISPHCTICRGALSPPSLRVVGAEPEDYYDYLARSEDPPFRLNSEELTGQTNRIDRLIRQRRFPRPTALDSFMPREQHHSYTNKWPAARDTLL